MRTTTVTNENGTISKIQVPKPGVKRLSKTCPKLTEPGSNFNCHRYDQSLFAVLLHNLYNHDLSVFQIEDDYRLLGRPTRSRIHWYDLSNSTEAIRMREYVQQKIKGDVVNLIFANFLLPEGF